MNVSFDQKPAKAAVHRLLAAFDSIAVPAMEAPPIAPLESPVEPVAVKAEPAAETMPADEKPSEAAPAVEKAADAPVLEIDAAETQIADVKPSQIETQAKPAEATTAENQPAEAELVEVKPVEATLLDAKPVAIEPVETKPVDLKPVDIEAVDSSMAAPKPAEAEPAPVLAAKIDATGSGTTKSPRAKPLDAKSAEAEFSRLATSPASRRFRESASAQITAARERITHRNLSSAMTMALAIGVLSAGVAGGTGYLAGLSEKSTTHAVALEQTVLRTEAEMMALRSEMDRTARATHAATSETGQRLERIEKAQAEPLAKLGKLAEMIEKLRNTQASTIAASKIDSGDVTGSVSPQQGGKGRASTTVVEAWVLREFDKDVALIEGKRGLLEIAVGDEIPGLGRVEGFRKHDGRWAVVTSKGLIVSR